MPQTYIAVFISKNRKEKGQGAAVPKIILLLHLLSILNFHIQSICLFFYYLLPYAFGVSLPYEEILL